MRFSILDDWPTNQSNNSRLNVLPSKKIEHLARRVVIGVQFSFSPTTTLTFSLSLSVIYPTTFRMFIVTAAGLRHSDVGGPELREI